MKISSLLILLLICLGSCSNGNRTDRGEAAETAIDFGPTRRLGNADLLQDIRLISLQTDSNCLVGSIDQIEWFDHQIYLLDGSRERTLYRFSETGQFIDKIVPGEGNGQFLMPFSFQIDSAGQRLIVKDVTKNYLLTYDLQSLAFTGKIEIAGQPVSFGLLPSSDRIAYYHLTQTEDLPWLFSYQDTAGHILRSFLSPPAYTPIFHGKRCVFYTYRDQLHGFPYFENKIYTFDADSARLKYTLAFGAFEWPENDFFRKFQHNTKVIGEELLHSGKIRMMEPYETDEMLLVKYYIGKEIYLGGYDKNTRRTVNLKADEIKDEIGLGAFPAPKGVYGSYFVSAISRDDLSDREKRFYPQLSALIEQSSEGDNPVICLYRFHIPEDY